MTNTIAQAWITGPGSIEVRRHASRPPDGDEVLMRPAYAGICGSDLHTLHRGHPWLDYPVGPGHEVSGTIAAVGERVTMLAPGDHVYLQPLIVCGRCFYCRRGRENLCEALVAVGAHLPGGLARELVVPSVAARPVPAGMSLEAASLVEPATAAVHAVSRAGDLRQAAVVILGGGTIGLLVLAACAAVGAADIAVTDLSERKLEFARQAGAAVAVRAGGDAAERLKEALSHRPDAVFDCVASASTVRDATALVRKGGVVVVVGAGHGDAALSIAALQDDEVTVTGSAMYRLDEFAQGERLVEATGWIPDLVTARFPIHRSAEAFAAAGDASTIKVQIAL